MSGIQIKEILPKQGELYQEDLPSVILCKPKLIPLKSLTLEKLEKMQNEAQEIVRQQELEVQQQQQQQLSEEFAANRLSTSSESSEVNRLTL